MIEHLKANPSVARVEPDTLGHAVDIDIGLSNAWGVERIGSGDVHDLNIGTGVNIAIVDSGVDYTHPDLNDNYAGGYDFIRGDGYPPMDVYGHGPHVAGTACAEDNDNGVDDESGKFGVVGVAPGCTLNSLRALDDNGWGYASETIAAMQWAMENGMDVVNLSLGWDRNPGDTFKAAFDNAWAAALIIASGITDNDAVRQRLRETADDLGTPGRDPLYGYGLVDACEAGAPQEPLTDIAITALDAPSSVVRGSLVDINVTVKNVGNQAVTGDIPVTLQDETDGVAIGIPTTVGGLAAGASTTLTFSWDTSVASTGEHILVASHGFADDNAANDAASTTVAVNEPSAEVEVRNIDPDEASAGSLVPVTISGDGFIQGARVTLENGDGPAPTVSNVMVVDSGTITADITVKSAGPPKNRVWDVRVTNPDGSSGVLVGGFTVTL